MIAEDLSQFINRRVLIVNRKLRVANDVDEQDMRDFELNFFFNLGGHSVKLRENKGIHAINTLKGDFVPVVTTALEASTLALLPQHPVFCAEA